MKTPDILPEHETLFQYIRKEKLAVKFFPEKFYPWWLKPCTVKVLLLTDGSLDFSMADFGLGTFVSILQNDGRSYVRFDLTLAHRSLVSDARVQAGAPGISRSIKEFRFDNASHFTDTMYDQVWFFGFNTTSGLSDAELAIVSTFMNNGGGVFATGDHGELGRALCGKITRVRSMRRWDNSSGEVGMGDGRRNDTNRIGHDAGSQFDDQSDDIPQTIQPKLYFNRVYGIWRESYPHPLLCSPKGRITVLPDHPHEGECIVPTDLTLTYSDGTPEFPMGIAPQVIATSTVPAGNNAGGSKAPTEAHSFGAICAYDGHRAGVGRVVTDATWHHFVNVNLVGEVSYPDTHVKGLGFLASPQGQEHFNQIKHYYINIAVWISRASNHQCFHSRLIWQLLLQHRVLEATMDNPTSNFEKISLPLLYSIGTHASDVLGKSAGHCRRLQLIIDICRLYFPELALWIDPWDPRIPVEQTPIPWLDLNPLLNIAMGAGLFAVRDKFGLSPDKVNDKMGKEILEVFQQGAKKGIEIGIENLNGEFKKLAKLK